jgi:ribosomal protein L37AE/L43A
LLVSAGPRFVDVPADRLLGELREIGGLIAGVGGSFVEGKQGREVVVDFVPPGGRALVRVYTSLAAGAAAVRDCGEDAVRIVVGVETPERFRPLESGQKLLRTAPRASADRVGVFLARLREQLRAAYGRAKAIPACPTCGRAMTLRESKHGSFWGCTGYPECKGTRRTK